MHTGIFFPNAFNLDQSSGFKEVSVKNLFWLQFDFLKLMQPLKVFWPCIVKQYILVFLMKITVL